MVWGVRYALAADQPQTGKQSFHIVSKKEKKKRERDVGQLPAMVAVLLRAALAG